MALLDLSLFHHDNLVAWCVVPYDARGRSPRERAAMLTSLGLSRLAWDWREEHVLAFGAELDAVAEFGVELTAIWTPVPMSDDDGGSGPVPDHVRALAEQAARRGLSPALWACAEFGPPGPVAALPPREQGRQVRRTADHLEPLVGFAAEQGLPVALYPHLGWFGEPENLVEVIDALADRGLPGTGLVYFQHHGHAHLERFAELLPVMVPHLRAFGLNGMLPGAHWGDGKVYPYGQGPHDVELARLLATSGWHGPVSIIGHTMDDVEVRLRDNLAGLDWVVARLRGDSEVTEQPPSAAIPHPVWPH